MDFGFGHCYGLFSDEYYSGGRELDAHPLFSETEDPESFSSFGTIPQISQHPPTEVFNIFVYAGLVLGTHDAEFRNAPSESQPLEFVFPHYVCCFYFTHSSSLTFFFLNRNMKDFKA